MDGFAISADENPVQVPYFVSLKEGLIGSIRAIHLFVDMITSQEHPSIVAYTRHGSEELLLEGQEASCTSPTAPSSTSLSCDHRRPGLHGKHIEKNLVSRPAE